MSPSTSALMDSSSGYNRPPDNILEVMHAQKPPIPHISPTSKCMMLVSWENHPPMERISIPYLRLAGIRFQPQNYSKRDTAGGYGIRPRAIKYELLHLEDGKAGARIPISLPDNVLAESPIWSADGKRFAFVNVTTTNVQVWMGDSETGKIRQVPGIGLNQMLGDEIQWMPDNKTLLVKLVPELEDPPPAEPKVPEGPSIQETFGEKGASSTYEGRDLLTNKYDEDCFDYYGKSQLAFVDTESLEVKQFGEPAIYWWLDPAPDGKNLLVRTIVKPFSYTTTYRRFAHTVEVWNISDCSNIKTLQVASLPVADRVPVHGVRLGPRGFFWQAHPPATLMWAEALDQGDWNVDVPARDQLMRLRVWDKQDPETVTSIEQRLDDLVEIDNSDLALVNEVDENRQWRRKLILNMKKPEDGLRELFSYSSNEKYEHPGIPVQQRLLNGSSVIRSDGHKIHLSGTGSTPNGDRPFLDELDIETKKSKRLFRSDANRLERFYKFDGSNSNRFYTWLQSATDPPNVYARTIKDSVTSPKGENDMASTLVPITDFRDPTPIARQVEKHLVTYKRDDGVDLSFVLYTPVGYKKGTRVPTILYAYPRDYAESRTAGQVTGSEATFSYLEKHRLLLLAGYAILDNASFPITGDPKKAYDTYLTQLVANADAAINKAVEMGVADPDRIGVTGHSHGALMAVNLLAHSQLFTAAVATSGAYNKTLTPFGFQNERRSVWDAPTVYQDVSPFFAADKIKLPLLIMHGMDDANPGTQCIQSSELYKAIRGNGGTSRLVLLPNEPHHYNARESNEQLVYEMLTWFDKYVKKASGVDHSGGSEPKL